MARTGRRWQRLLELLPEEHGNAPCPHVAQGCGGCLMQEWPYEAQLEAKRGVLKEIYGTAVDIVPCNDPLGYRNRMDFVCTAGKIGLRQRGRFNSIVDVADCLLLPGHAREAYRKIRDMLAQEKIPGYDLLTHEGFLRYVVIRTSRARDETMVVLTTVTPTTPEEHARHEGLFRRILDETCATSVHWRINDGMTDVSIGEPYRWFGKEFVLDEIAGKQFLVYPETFFQANTRMAEELFLKVKALAKGKVLDLYCGVGVIAILVHDSESVETVTGVEIVEQSIAAAKENAQINKVPQEKCEFFAADVAAYLRDKQDAGFDTVICDPARPGLGEKVCRSLLAMRPARIIYVSCNPLTHREDIARLASGYALTLLEAHDLFPQTPHVEVLSVLEAKR